MIKSCRVLSTSYVKYNFAYTLIVVSNIKLILAMFIFIYVIVKKTCNYIKLTTLLTATDAV